MLVLRYLLFIKWLLVVSAFANQDSLTFNEATQALSQLAEKHRNSNNFFLKFDSKTLAADGEVLPKSSGSLLASDSGRFRLQHAQGLVVSDGKTLWQYFPAQKQVIVKSGQTERGEAGGVLRRFLEAKIISAKRIPNGFRTTLNPSSVGETLDSLILTLDSKPLRVRHVETQDASGAKVTYLVQVLRHGVKTKASDFTFSPPKGVEVVDMR